MNSIKLPSIDIKKYGGKQVGIVNGEIIAVGNTLQEVIAEARKQVPHKPLKEISFFAVPRTLSVIYYAADISVRHYSTRRRKDGTVSCR